MRIFPQFFTGLIFGLGLVISGMSNPAKVQNFLDVWAIASGGWDPSLLFVMAGAIIVTSIGYRLAWRQPRPVLADRFDLPTATSIDLKLVAGPAIFGIGWGLAGVCPGPAFTLLPLRPAQAASFVIAMLAGMFAARWLAHRTIKPALIRFEPSQKLQ